MILDLVNKESSDIKYELLSFPDGQQDIKIDVHSMRFENTEIKARLTDFRDLEKIVCAVKALNNMGIPGKGIDVTCYYLLGARSDRKFVEGGTSYLRDVIAPILNSLDLGVIKVMDVHSEIAEAVIPNLFSMSNKKLVDFALGDVYGLTPSSENEHIENSYKQMCIISPDAGAMKKIYSLTKSLAYTGELICASKHRDVATGKIMSTEVNYTPNITSKDLFIIDDICDGGRTFIEMVKVIRTKETSSVSYKPAKIYLIVTHGIFSNGLKELSQYFDCIYTTNSFREYNSMTDWGMHQEKYLHKLKTLNIWK